MWATVLAQQVPSDLTGWLTGSAVTVLAFVVLAFIRGWIVPGVIYTRTLKENDDLKAEARGLQAVFLEKVIPTLTRATDLMARSAERERSN
jgi:hypothetical protein